MQHAELNGSVQLRAHYRRHYTHHYRHCHHHYRHHYSHYYHSPAPAGRATGLGLDMWAYIGSPISRQFHSHFNSRENYFAVYQKTEGTSENLCLSFFENFL